MKRKSIKTSILIPLLAGLIIGITVLSLIAIDRASNIVTRLTDERTYGAARAVTAMFKNLEDESRVVSVSVASNYTVINNVLSWNADEDKEQSRQNLIRYLQGIVSETNANSFVVRDAEGVMILRLHDLNNYGDADGSPSGLAALRGETTTAFSSTPTMPLGLNTTTPIIHNGEIIGTMAPLYFLHTEEFMNSYAQIFNAEVAIYNREERLATTFISTSGQRGVGEPVSSYVADTVIERGETLMTRENIYGAGYHTYYMPVNGLAGPVGAFSVSFSTEYADGAMLELMRGLIISGLVILAGVVILLIAIVNWQTKKLPKITSAAEAISIGDIEIDGLDEGTEPTNNEITKLERAFSHMVTSFRRQAYILARVAEGDYSSKVEIRSDKDVINTAIALMLEETQKVLHQVTSAGIQVSSSSKQIAEGAQLLAQGSTEQAATVEQLSTSMAVIAEKTKDNAEMAEKAASLAGSIKHNAEKGTRQMGEMMGAVKDINQAGQSIGKVIKVIDDIAFQTNILALNAAVEAARAGQHGKGFAVVAEEVRNLAAKSAEAAKDTGDLITNSIEKAELGSRIAGETAASLEEIVSGINESTKIVNDIALSSDEQYQNITQINKGVEQVAQVVQQNSATAEQSAAASEEMSGQSAMLEKIISQFHLGDDDRFKSNNALPPHRG